MAVIIVYPNVTGGDIELGFFDGVTVTSKNIFTGAGNSSKPQFFQLLGNQLIFQATDADGRELWITDGTAAGTHQIENINPTGDAFSNGGNPSTSYEATLDERPAVLNGLAFFGASDGSGAGAHGREPWVTDGTNGAGTHMLLDIRSGPTGSGAHDFVTFGSFVYFIANDGTHEEIWKTDGTTTTKVTTLPGGAAAGPEFGSLTVSGSNLFFVYNDGTDRRLYVLDATPAGAHAVPISPIPDGATIIAGQPPAHLTDVNGTLYFAQYDNQHGLELWKSDGTTATFIKNIATGDVPGIPIFNDGNPSDFVAFDGEIYFVASDGTSHGRELWKTNGTDVGTVRVTDINSNVGVNGGNSFFFPQQLIVVNNALYFAAINGTNDFELYRVDTSDVLTKIDVNPGGISSTPFSLVGADGKLYFAAQPGAATSETLFRLDGLTPTPLAADYSTAFPFANASFDRFGAIETASAPPAGGLVFFTTWKSPLLADRNFDHELGVYDGVTATIINIFPGNDVAPDDKSSQPTSFAALGGKMYFWADGGDGNGTELWVSDGTAPGTHLFLNINPGAADSIQPPISPVAQGTTFVPLVINNVMYFRADNGANGLELWRSDGTVPGTFMLKDIRPGGPASWSIPTAFTDVGGTLYFAADDGNGQEIWKSDGTGPGTVRVTNIGVDPTGAFPDGLVNFGGQLAFRASSVGPMDFNLYVTDGTTVTPLLPAGVTANSNPVVAGGKLFFSANQAGFGPEPWVSNGTPGGTHRIDDLRPGNDGSQPLQMTVVGSNVFFIAFTAATGMELFKWDSSSDAPSSLSLVKDLNGTGADSNIDNLINVNGTLFFTADPDGPGGDGLRLYKTDGTDPGTVIVDPTEFALARDFRAFGSTLYFAGVGTTDDDDRFLWRSEGDDATTFAITDKFAHFDGFRLQYAAILAETNTPPVQHFNTGTTVNEGAGTTIVDTQLDFDDAQEGDAQIVYTVTSPTANGTLFRNGIPLGLGGTFTQDDIVNNLLSYTHNGGETVSDSFGFSVSDGIAPAVTGQTFAITVTPQNDPPVLNNNTGTTVDEGASTTILNAQLDFNDPDNANSQIVYTVTSVTANGTLFRNAIALGLGGTFTQGDIVNNLLSYAHNGGETASDQFGFSVTDGIAAAITGQTFAITVTPQNDPPAITSNGGGAAASIDLLENAAAVTTVTATDPDGPSLAFSIVGGDDAARFQIDASSGALSFVTAPNFESPTDLDHNSSYLVQVRAFDGSLSDDQLITVQVGDVTEVLHWFQSVDAGAHPDPNPDAHLIIRGLGDTTTPGWAPSGIGDFNNDATSDLAWYNPGTNRIDIWKLQNGGWAGSADTGAHPAGSQPAGYGDYNGDGTDDILWFNETTREVGLWKISNGNWAGSVNIGTHPAGWTPELSGDFNADGTDDILWYNPTNGNADIWKINNNGQWAGSIDVGAHPSGWRPDLAGDFNGDGTDDVLWYNPANGNVDIWTIQNGNWAGSANLGDHPLGWQPLGAADFNTDGTDDVVWYNPTTNNIDVWLVKNGQWSQSVNIGSHPAGWIAVGVGDFDHSGVNDVAWFNPGTGQIENWLLAYN